MVGGFELGKTLRNPLEVPTIYKAYVREYPHKMWLAENARNLRIRSVACDVVEVDCRKGALETKNSSEIEFPGISLSVPSP